MEETLKTISHCLQCSPKQNTEFSSEMSKCSFQKTPLFSFEGYPEFFSKVLDVYDGDTITIVFIVQDQCFKMNCRLNGIDTPEMKSNNLQSKKTAIRARNQLIEWISGKRFDDEDCQIKRKTIQTFFGENNFTVWVKCGPFDKYGRVLVDIWSSDDKTKHLNAMMEKCGLGKEYFGGKKG